jgi:Na+-transporting methylmalonyl-CoA/oxaloacetate decarboxylase gamma subunit
MNVSLLGEGVRFSLIAQSSVFLVLFLLALVILALKFIFYRPAGRKAAAAGEAEPPPGEEGKPGNLKKVAAIAAALAMHRQGGAPEAPAVVGQEGPWAPRTLQGRAVTSQIKTRRWSNG